MHRLALPRMLLVIVALTTALAVVGTTTVFAALIGRDGKAVTAVRTVVDNTYEATTSLSYANVPSMTKTVSVPSGERGLLIITFSATTYCADAGTPASVYCFVRALVDGAPAPPGEVIFDSAGAGANNGYQLNVHSMQWVLGRVGSGQHTVTIQYRVDENDGTFSVYARSLTVLLSKQPL